MLVSMHILRTVDNKNYLISYSLFKDYWIWEEKDEYDKIKNIGIIGNDLEIKLPVDTSFG